MADVEVSVASVMPAILMNTMVKVMIMMVMVANAEVMMTVTMAMTIFTHPKLAAKPSIQKYTNSVK